MPQYKHIKRFGRCFNCKRLLPLKYLEQIEFYDNHIINGEYHHKLLCRSCKKKAEEVFNGAEEIK